MTGAAALIWAQDKFMICRRPAHIARYEFCPADEEILIRLKKSKGRKDRAGAFSAATEP